MPKIKVEHDSALEPKDAYTKIKSFFEGDDDLRRLDPKLACTFTDASMTGKATGSQFNADISVKGGGGGSKVTIAVDIPFLLTPFKGKIEDTIKRKVAKYLV